MEDVRNEKTEERTTRCWPVMLAPRREREEAIRWQLLTALAKRKQEGRA